MIHSDFRPDPVRATALDQRMRDELANSLEHVRQQLATQSPDQTLLKLLDRLDPVLVMLRSDQRIAPIVFGLYYRLVFTIIDNLPGVPDILAHLIKSARFVDNLSFRDLDPEGMGGQENVDVYLKCFNSDHRIVFDFLPPTRKNSQHMQVKIEETLSLMREIVPALYGEIMALVVEFVFASAPDTPGANQFDGASSYQLWGTITLNVDEDRTFVNMLESLAHEVGHSLLFGLTIHEPLVMNSGEETYKSPLRRDPRPMDGIYHATFVSARMHYAMQEAVKSPLLSESQKEECRANLVASSKAFFDGYEVISTRASYTESGREIMHNTYEYMQSVAADEAVA